MLPSQLMHALAVHLGEPLTPEVAAHVLAVATAEVMAPIDVEQFAELHVGAYVIRCERLRDILTEIHPLHVAHWHETERHLAGLPLVPNYNGALVREAAGVMLQVVLRHERGLVGHLRMDIGVSNHSGTRFAAEDALYITPEHRGGFTVLRMMRYAECCLLALDVREIRASSKLVNNADVLMRRMGYKQVAIEFVKLFTEDEAREQSGAFLKASEAKDAQSAA